jgi:hypothetical protein
MTGPTTYANVCQRLVEEVPELGGVLREHLADNFNELLPHLFFYDVTRVVVDNCGRVALSASGNELGVVTRIVAFMEQAMSAPDELVPNLVGVSFVENLSDELDVVRQIYAHCGPKLRKELAWYFDESQLSGSDT